MHPCSLLILLSFMTSVFASPLVPLNSPQGSARLQTSSINQDFFTLAPYFITQRNQAFCGVASSVMILNALNIPRPYTYQYAPNYRLFTQENVFNRAVSQAGLNAISVQTKGMTLEQVAILIEKNGANTKTWLSNAHSETQFQNQLQQALKNPSKLVIINYYRRALNQAGGGHIAPVVAYHAATQSYLILDVARYKAPPVWVPARQLWQAVFSHYNLHGHTQYRGMLIIQARSIAHAPQHNRQNHNKALS